MREEARDTPTMCSNLLCDNTVEKPDDYDGGYVLCEDCKHEKR